MVKRLVIPLLCIMTCAAAPLPAQVPIGVYPSYPPLDMRDPETGTLNGFDIELGQHLAKKVGTTFVMQETAFAQLVASVETGRIRLFFNGMNDTPARQQLVSFVDYLRSGTQFMVLASNAGAYVAESALCGKTVAASRSTSAPAQITAWSQAHCAAKNLPSITVLGADNSIDARSELKQGRANAMAQDSLTIPYVQQQSPGTYSTVGQPFDLTIMGIGVTKSDTALQTALAGALQRMIADGSYGALIKKWHLPASSAVSRATINGVS